MPPPTMIAFMIVWTKKGWNAGRICLNGRVARKRDDDQFLFFRFGAVYASPMQIVRSDVRSAAMILENCIAFAVDVVEGYTTVA